MTGRHAGTEAEPLHEKLREHYALRILLVCCCISGTVAGMVVHCRGVFYQPAAAALGVSPTTYATYLTCGGLAGVVVMPWVTRWFRTKPIKKVMLAYLAVMFGSVALLGVATSMWQCYLIGTCQGCVSSFLTLYPVSTLIKNWFTKRRGLMMGLASTFAGILASIMNVVIERVISAYGWRCAYLAVALAGFVISAVPVFLFLVREPADIGMTPYGGPEQDIAPAPEASSAPAQQDVGPPAGKGTLFSALPFFLLAVACYSSGGYVQHMSNYAAQLGFAGSVGASLISVGMLGNTGGKLLGGVLNDWMGIYKTAILTLLSSAAAFVILAFRPQSLPLLYLAAALCGQTTAFIAVQIPLLLGAAFRDKKQYERCFAGVMRAGSLTSAVNNMVISFLYGLNGSYLPGHLISAALLFGSAATVGLMQAKSRRMSRRGQPGGT